MVSEIVVLTDPDLWSLEVASAICQTLHARAVIRLFILLSLQKLSATFHKINCTEFHSFPLLSSRIALSRHLVMLLRLS